MYQAILSSVLAIALTCIFSEPSLAQGSEKTPFKDTTVTPKIIAPKKADLNKLSLITSKVENLKGGSPQTTNESMVNLEIQDLISMVSSRLNRKIIADPAVRGKASIFSPEKMSDAELYDSFLVSLELNGLTVVDINGFLTVVMARNATRMNIPQVSDPSSYKEERMISWIYKSPSLKAHEIGKFLGRVLSANGSLDVFEPTNSIVIKDFTNSVQHLQRLIGDLEKQQPTK